MGSTRVHLSRPSASKDLAVRRPCHCNAPVKSCLPQQRVWPGLSCPYQLLQFP